MNRNPIHDFSPLGAFWRRLIPIVIVSMAFGFVVATCAGTLDVTGSAVAYAADDTTEPVGEGDDTAAAILLLDVLTPVICDIADQGIEAGLTPTQVIESGTYAFAVTFGATTAVNDHMASILTGCVTS